eukprot:TRINITY_DN2061_c0_g1_i18.p1 TRINITY_DN2061_c0_g1~~TRINITY_DN2061_c0_g1_i18.p1  ORF type:complete len:1315 (-),score=237.47 TRINITY_DN2061_c0_g1_i18:455-4399(-)
MRAGLLLLLAAAAGCHALRRWATDVPVAQGCGGSAERVSRAVACDGGEIHDCLTGGTNGLALCCVDCSATDVGTRGEFSQLFYPQQLPWRYTSVCVFLWQRDIASLAQQVTLRLYEDAGGVPKQDAFASKTAQFTLQGNASHWITVTLDPADGFVAYSWKVWLSVDYSSCQTGVSVWMGTNLFTGLPSNCTFHDTAMRSNYLDYWSRTEVSQGGVALFAFLLRATGENAGATVPAAWTCAANLWNDGSICNCNCSTYDPDCKDKSHTVVGCASTYSHPVCDSLTAKCVDLPATCTNTTFYDSLDGCQCASSCNVYDPDCNNFWSQNTVGCPSVGMWRCSSNNTCAVPAWKCASGAYNDGTVCNCGCGNVDPDCTDEDLPISGCNEAAAICGPTGDCTLDGWTCDVSYYDAGDGCDCKCGIIDPDCAQEDAKVWGCSKGQVCAYNSTCVDPGVCGNLYVEGSETCDGGLGCFNCSCQPGYLPSNEGCNSANCKTACGDGIAVFPEECDGGFGCDVCKCRNLSFYSPPQLGCGPACGNDVLDDGEECDGGSGCSACTCSSGHTKHDPPQLACDAQFNPVPVAVAVPVGVACIALALAALAAVVLLVLRLWKKNRIAMETQEAKSRDLMLQVKKHENAFMIDPAEIQLQERIGAGSFGTVYRALWRGTIIAVKKIDAAAVSGVQMSQFEQEVEIMRGLRHPNCLLFMGFAKTPETIFILTEYMPQGSLADALRNGSVYMSFAMMLNIAHDVALGLNFLHTNKPPILHRDMKSANLLLSANFTAKVCDFGLTIFSDTAKADVIGSLLWTAPEVLRGEYYTQKADVYSYGIVLWEIVTREQLYIDLNPHCVATRVVDEDFRPTIPGSVPQPIAELMRNCWAPDPINRPSFEDILQDWNRVVSATDSQSGSLIMQQVQAPVGVVTLVFTDIQGSTALWEWNSVVMRKALMLHHDVIRCTYRALGGYEVKTEGDAFMLAFDSSVRAVKFCVRAQLALLEASWDSVLSTQRCCETVTHDGKTLYQGFRVRMGIHVGEPTVEQDKVTGRIDYIGQDVNKAARVAAMAQGGQILLSSAAFQEIANAPPLAHIGEAVEFGVFALKGISQPETVYSFVPSELKGRTFSPQQCGSLSMSFPSMSFAIRGAGNSQVEGNSDKEDYAGLLYKERKSWMVPFSELNVSSERIGVGNFGEVFKGEWRGQIVSIKRLLCQKMDSITMAEVQVQLREVAILSELRHPNIVLFMCACVEPPNMCIVTEWMEQGSLREILAKGALQWQYAHHALLSITQGVTFLHQSGIIHRDLKCANVLVGAKWDVKLADFGLR